MNREWMRAKLNRFEALCRNRIREYETLTANQAHARDATIISSIPTVRQILDRLKPGLTDQVKNTMDEESLVAARSAALQGIGILDDQDEWAANLEPDAPVLIADQFHPRIWAAAAALWDTGKYRVAVSQAAVALSAHIASKAQSSLTDRKLVNEVLAPSDPPAGKTRLHMPGSKDTETWKSRQDGIHHLAQGAFAGIRNIAAHDEGEWPEQIALEHLAVLSVVARWTDKTRLIKGK